jgi:O-antigen/teichoic acid export membrane protein
MSSVEPRSPPAQSGGAAEPDLLDTPQAGSRALRGGSLRTGGYALSILLSLVAVPLLIRHLGIAGYGRYVTVISVVAVVAGLTEGGLNAIALRGYATTGVSERQRMMRDALGVRLVLTTVGALAAVTFSVLAGYGEPLVLGTALAGVGMLLQLVQGLLAVPLESELRFGWVTAGDLLRQLVNVGLLVGLVLAGAGVVSLLGVAIPASAASLLFTIWLVRGRVPLRPAFAVRKWWPLVRDSIPWAIVAAVNVVYFRLAIIIMSIAASAVQTGYFATSLRVIEVLIGVPAVAVGAVYPILARTAHGDRGRFAYASGRLFELSLVVGTWMVVCLEIGAPFAIHVLAGDRADPSVAVLRIQGLAVIATFIAVGCGFPLLTLRRFRDALLANFVALLLSGVLTITLVDPLGARGAAIAAVSAEFVMAALVVRSLKRAAPDVDLSPVAVLTVALAGAAAVGLGLLLPVHPVIGAAVASGAYFLLLRAFGRFPPEVREFFAGRIGALTR